MKIGVIIPDRGDRPQFLSNCARMIKKQTIKPDRVCLMQYQAESEACDITQRYRRGYDLLREKGLDFIAFIENDDWYSPNYLEYMAKEWEKRNRPDLFGTNYTIYYHLSLRAYFKFQHVQRASMMNTIMKPDLEFTWPKDADPYTDMWLWMEKSGITDRQSFEPDHLISIGMKHGIGKIGGFFHLDAVERYINDDAKSDFLRQHLDEESLKFYLSVFKDQW